MPKHASVTTAVASAVSVGNYRACAITAVGVVEWWGEVLACNGVSQPPRPLPGRDAGVIDVSVMGDIICVVTAGSAVECLGGGSTGALGNGSTADSWAPVQVTGLTSGATSVSVGGLLGNLACAVTAGGGVQCWGYNGRYQLGDGTRTNSSVPVQVTGLTSGATSVSVGDNDVCAVTTGGVVQCWGGDNLSGNSGVPHPIVASGMAAVSIGNTIACVLSTSGGVSCWDGATPGSPSGLLVPAPVPGLSSGVTAIAVGGDTACAITAGGGVECWGGQTYGQLGNGTTAASSVPVQSRVSRAP